MLTNRKVFNIDDALERFCGDEELLRDLADMFVHESQFSSEKLDNLLQEGQTDKACSMIHMLKGTSGTLGAEQLYDQCIKTENILKGKEEGNFQEEKASLYLKFGIAIETIKEYLNNKN